MTLARNYVTFLVRREMGGIKPFLSLDFLKRQKVMQQLRLIHELPHLLYGVGLGVHLFEHYTIGKRDKELFISPFQFQISYLTQMDLVDMERTTITIQSVVLEENTWKIESIITDEDGKILQNVVEKGVQARRSL